MINGLSGVHHPALAQHQSHADCSTRGTGRSGAAACKRALLLEGILADEDKHLAWLDAERACSTDSVSPGTSRTESVHRRRRPTCQEPPPLRPQTVRRLRGKLNEVTRAEWVTSFSRTARTRLGAVSGSAVEERLVEHETGRQGGHRAVHGHRCHARKYAPATDRSELYDGRSTIGSTVVRTTTKVPLPRADCPISIASSPGQT